MMRKIIFQQSSKLQMPFFFLIARLILFLSLPLSGVRSYGDFWNFFQIAQLGTPFLNNWVEFPPLFPFLSRLIYLAVGGRQHTFELILALMFSIVQAMSIYMFQLIAEELSTRNNTQYLVLQYSFLLVGLFYGWAYFDSLAVFALLLGIYLLLKEKDLLAGFALGIGGLIKFFPVLVLVSGWKWRGSKQAAKSILIVTLLFLTVYGTLYLAAPENTLASIVSQGKKGSWETVWALLDNNWKTGNFSPEINRLDPQTAYLASGNPAVIPPWITLILFAGIGLVVFILAKVDQPESVLSFAAFTMLIFLLWSPGYSPQWVLYLLPFSLLCLNNLRGTILSITLVLVNLAEWPVLLSRGEFQYLGGLIIVRTILMLILIGSMLQIVFQAGGKGSVKSGSET